MADVVVGAQLTADNSQYVKSVREIKQELKAAEGAVISMSEKFGATSAQAAEAAKRAAELKDKIGDAKTLVDAFNPDTKFRAFGASIQTVVGGFTALTGVMGLLGVESEQVQKTLLKVQSALALSQGIAQLQEGMQAFKNLGSVIVNTLGKSGMIGVAIAGVAALGAAILGVFDGASVKVKELNNSLKELVKAESDAGKEVNILTNTFKQAKLGIISKEEALKKYNEGIGKTIGFAKDLNEAEKLTVDNADAYIKVQGLKAQSNYLLGKSSELEAEARMAQLELEQSSFKYYAGASEAFHEKIEKNKKDAEDLKLLIKGINQEIAKASTGFKTVPATGRATTTPEKVKTEQKQINYEYSTPDDNRIQNYLDLLKRFAADRKLLIELGRKEAKEEAEEEFKERIALLNLELEIEEQAARKKRKIDEDAFTAKQNMAKSIGNLLGGLSEMLGQQTAAGKVFAVAEATINTYAAIAGSLRAFAGKPIPGYAIVQAIATGIFGLAQVRKILAVKVPGAGGGGSVPSVPSGASVNAPTQLQLPQSTSTRLDRDQLNQIGNAAVRAFVVETDMTNNQERVRRLNRAARLG